MVCLDTDIIIDFLRNKEYAIEKIKKFQEKGALLLTTSVNTFELFKGAFKSSKKEDFDIIERFISDLGILNFDLDSSIKCAEIFNELKRSGEIIDPIDLMIASIVLTKKESLLTNNIKHFKRIPNLILEK
jgi:predicted nucleic acid-binding protein